MKPYDGTEPIIIEFHDSITTKSAEKFLIGLGYQPKNMPGSSNSFELRIPKEKKDEVAEKLRAYSQVKAVDTEAVEYFS